jgi:uncharacterized BrkB/YihY/UPF0761 family membrane protein
MNGWAVVAIFLIIFIAWVYLSIRAIFQGGKEAAMAAIRKNSEMVRQDKYWVQFEPKDAAKPVTPVVSTK